MFYYKVYNFTIQTPFAINELVEIFPQKVDIVISESDIDNSSKNISSQGEFFNGQIKYTVYNNNSTLLTISGIGRYYVGRNFIDFERFSGVSNDDIIIYLLGFSFSFLFSMNKTFALHGSAVCKDNGCIVFIGESGAGKSTTAAHLINQGFNMITDDVCLITFDKNGTPWVHPAYPQLKLWEDSAKKLKYDTQSLEIVSNNWKKYRVPSHINFNLNVTQLKAIYFLEPSTDLSYSITELTGFDKLLACTRNIYNRRATLIFNLDKEYFEFCTGLASIVPIKKINRPISLELIEDMIHDLKNDIYSNF